ncbi:MAG: LLM class flavin-dependent oxidoreductase [Candidatus Limnocylindria bacterium]
MRIGIIIGLHGPQGRAPTWRHIRDQVLAAEAVGFDVAVVEDALLYPGQTGPSAGSWESVAMVAAMAVATSRVEVGQSVINAPYRTAALTAKIAETLDEISGGRYVLGIGLGNTDDYDQFGVPADHRYARFEESIRIIHSLLRTGKADADGTYQFARKAELIPRGPRSHGPPIVIAAGGPKMLRLAARYADGWNWWTQSRPDLDSMRALLTEMERACEEVGRDPATLSRSLDLYSVDPLGTFQGGYEAISGSPEDIAETLLGVGMLGFGEVRVNVAPVDALEALPRAVEALAEVVELVHGVESAQRPALAGSAVETASG